MAWYKFSKVVGICLMSIVIISCKSNDSTSTNSPNAPSTGNNIQALQISRHTSADIDTTAADNLLRAATTTLQTKDGVDDVSCDIVLARQGNISTFSVGDGTVNSEEDFKALVSLPGHVKVVNQINWCDVFKPNIIGCAPTPGESFVVVRHRPNFENILWLHELGHNKGLTHRDHSKAVMHEIIDITHRQVNQTESNALTP